MKPTLNDMGMGLRGGFKAFWPLGLVFAILFGGLTFIFLPWWGSLLIAIFGFYIGTRLPFLLL